MNKFRNNTLRDRRVASQLRRMGWHVFTVWECETNIRGFKTLNNKLQRLKF